MSEPVPRDVLRAAFLRILETGTDRIPKGQALCYPTDERQPARGAKGDEHAE